MTHLVSEYGGVPSASRGALLHHLLWLVLFGAFRLFMCLNETSLNAPGFSITLGNIFGIARSFRSTHYSTSMAKEWLRTRERVLRDGFSQAKSESKRKKLQRHRTGELPVISLVYRFVLHTTIHLRSRVTVFFMPQSPAPRSGVTMMNVRPAPRIILTRRTGIPRYPSGCSRLEMETLL